MILVWRASAEQDLERIADYIGSHDLAAAAKVENRVRAAIEHLEQFPRAGRTGHRVGTREVVLTEYPYVIRYRLAADQVQILRIFHTSTEWMSR